MRQRAPFRGALGVVVAGCCLATWVLADQPTVEVGFERVDAEAAAHLLETYTGRTVLRSNPLPAATLSLHFDRRDADLV